MPELHECPGLELAPLHDPCLGTQPANRVHRRAPRTLWVPLPLLYMVNINIPLLSSESALVDLFNATGGPTGSWYRGTKNWLVCALALFGFHYSFTFFL